ncbi:oligopeptide/dipeptide ABC transporter, ATP-binding protein [Halobacteroides halobius DSM 5150]|uniref:Oligopeptide/dipeptide ABC transporter, ATP-binding protein n=1 Tax=Halobacteroides halobius (strain ATCC 35273 / DSM 5150 / MD-1) TaxID=748449 RepID=L0KDE5_HALHC|nr:ABC transporter ATP-binding protein [Halobacteroides halobius]AGB42389.1 oligopeptide/dipeptide ABC transporter, ATP-binding protein [Halobacteroides halobius DSM 5150]
MKQEKLLEIKNLKTHFDTPEGRVRAVDGVDLVIPKNTSIALVGESGSGKSVTAKSIMGLLPQPPAEINGEILYNQNEREKNLVELDPDGEEYANIRGNEISMIFQDPMTALNPVYTIGNQVMEIIIRHTDLSKKEARKRGIKLLGKVGIANPEQRFDEYPHQFSGGMRQRVMIAIGLACNPTLLIADEPTTAIDVTIQSGILDLIKELQAEFKTSLLLITHNLGVVAQIAEKVAVMYLGEIVEYADVKDIYHSPLHPYTKGLLEAVPVLGRNRGQEFTTIEGMVPDPFNIPAGCRFSTRCEEQCKQCIAGKKPQMIEVESGHYVKCWLHGGEANDGTESD